MNETKIYNFSFGSIKITKELAQFTIHRNEFTYSELQEIEHFLAQQPLEGFLRFQQIEENEGQVIITYEFIEHLKPVAAINKETYVVKLAIAQTILLDEVVTKEPNFVSLHPATIYYHPMSTVYYSYRANRLMPREEKYPHLHRYKALILMILTNHSYERCLVEPEHLEKRANDLVRSVLQAKTIEEMQVLITEAYDYVAYHAIQEQTAVKKKRQYRTFFGIAASLILGLGAVGYVKQDANEQQTHALQALTKSYETEQLEQEAESLFTEGRYTQAVPLLFELDYSAKDIAERLFKEQQWQLTLDTDPSFLEPVIEALYEKGEEETLLDLTMASTKEPYHQKLAHEKMIVGYDTAQMAAELPFISDEGTLRRLGQAFVKNGDMAGAREVLNKTQDIELKRAIEKAQAETELMLEKQKLVTLQTEGTANQVKLQQAKIKELEAKIQGLEGG